MSQYIDKFAGTINKRQSDQILKLLSRYRNTGQIRSIQEFTQKLESLMRELTSTTIQPLLRLYVGEKGTDIDSESYNFMLDRVEDDLITAFEEANNIDEVQRSHEAIIRDVILKNLRSAVAELDSKITLFEFLNKDLRGFDSAIFSTFRESKEERTLREGVQTKIFFVDPRLSNEEIPASEDASFELVGERLVLATQSSTFHTINSVRQIFDSNSPQSELVVEPPDNNILNIIDNTKGTFWLQSMLFTKDKPYIKTKLEFSLGSVKEINVIEIELASKHGLFLESIHYVDGNNVVTDLGIDEQFIESVASVKISKIATSRIILTFRNESSTKAIFEYEEDSESIEMQANRRSNVDNNIPSPTYSKFNVVSNNLIKNAQKDLDDLISSQKVKDVINVSTPESNTFTGYEFLTGVDNVRLGISKYRDKSIYVSTPLTVSDIGEIGLKTEETRPYIDASTGQIYITSTTYDIEDTLTGDSSISIGEKSNTWFQSSIEYWITRVDLNADGSINRTTTFPILPLDTERIYHERLILDSKSSDSLENNDLGSTMFYTTRTDGDIKVYRNGILIEYGVGWDDVTTSSDRTPNNLTPMKFNIQILDRLAGDIFTVSYTPVVSSTSSIPKTLDEYVSQGGLKVVDLVGDLTARVGSGQIITLDRVGKMGSGSKVYLAIIMRQNAADSSLTPAVEEYTLVAGTKDPTKFEET